MKLKSFISLAFLLLLGCAREQEPEQSRNLPSAEGEKVTLTFSVVTDGNDSPATKALGEATDLNTLYLAVFGRSGYLKEYSKATLLDYRDDFEYTYTIDVDGEERQVHRTGVVKYTFSVELTLTDNERIIHFIGNGPSTLNFGYADEILPGLMSGNGETAFWQMKSVAGIRAKRYTGNQPYEDAHGETVEKGDFIDNDGNKVTNGKTGYVPAPETVAALQDIPLIRNWAKIVVLQDKTVDPDTGEENQSYFTPYSYAVIHTPARGTIAPHSSETNGFVQDYQLKTFVQLEAAGYPANLPLNTAISTFVPKHSDFLNGTNGVAKIASGDVLSYPVPAGTEPGHAVYLYERPVPTEDMDPTSILVYGHYENPKDLEHKGDWYYKIDLMVGSKYYPVYRNFKYQVLIKKILSQGHLTPEDAAVAAGSADVSADISAMRLADISDGRARLALSWMARSFISQQTPDNNRTLSVRFIPDVDNVAAHTGSDLFDNTGTPKILTAEIQPMKDGSESIITSVSISDEFDQEGEQQGWRDVLFTTIDPTNPEKPLTSAKSQRILITGYFGDELEKRLYREVEITLLPVQDMKVSVAQEIIPDIKGSEQTVLVSIPDGLPQSMFPLVFAIEPERMSLTPDDNKTNNNLPVEWGTSIIHPEAGEEAKTSFHFLRTIDWTEYRSLKTTQENYRTWRTFNCYFKSNRDDSATFIYVSNEFFNQGKTRFFNSTDNKFRNLHYSTSIPCAENKPVDVEFQVRKQSSPDNPDGVYSEIRITHLMGMTPSASASTGIADFTGPDAEGYYSFTPTQDEVTLRFLTTVSDGNVVVQLELGEDEDNQTLIPFHFGEVWFQDGKKLSVSTNRWSNVAFGRVNNANNKTLLIGYFEDERQINAPVEVELVSGLKSLIGTKFTPSGPVTANGDPTFHEIELQTEGNNNPAQFILKSTGYVEKTVTAKRFSGNLFNSEYPNNPATDFTMTKMTGLGFNASHPSFSYESMTFSFNSVTSVDTQNGILLAGGTEDDRDYKTYTISVVHSDNKRMFYIQMDLAASNTWTWQDQDGNPQISVTTGAGAIRPYPGNTKQLVWSIPEDQNITAGTTPNTLYGNTVTFTVKVPQDQTFCINHVVLECGKTDFKFL